MLKLIKKNIRLKVLEKLNSSKKKNLTTRPRNFPDYFAKETLKEKAKEYSFI